MNLSLRAICCAPIIGAVLLCLPGATAKTNASEARHPIQRGNNLPGGVSAETQLKACLTLAHQGKIQQAYALAQQTKTEFGSQRLFNIGYLNTLISIVEKHDSEHNDKIVNEVIQLVNDLNKETGYRGSQDPEVAFHFMGALGRLSALTMNMSDSISASIRIQEGTIAKNLLTNPGYPQNALEALAAPLMSMAQGYAIQDNQAASFEALRLAVDAGYGGFATLVDDPLINRIADKSRLKELVTELKPRYQKAVKRWSKTVVAEFKPFTFPFDLPNAQGGRISQGDFKGKVVVIDLWATWCAPCRQGIPHFIRLQTENATQNVAVVGISMDNPQRPELVTQTVRDFMTEQKFNYPSGIGDQSIAAQIPGTATLPTTLFIDRSGKVRFIARGYHDYEKINAITSILANENQAIRASMPYGN